MSEAFFYGRVIERLLITGFGGVSLILGWNLFRAGILTDQVAELSKADAVVRLQKVGPGVFFALFGTIVLTCGLLRPVELTAGRGSVGDSTYVVARYSGPSAQEAKKAVTALNTILDIVRAPSSKAELSSADIADLMAVRSDVELLRNDIVRSTIGVAPFEVWVKYRSAFEADPSTVPGDVLPNVRLAASWMTARRSSSARQ